MVGRMPVDDIGGTGVDEAVGEVFLEGGNVIAPVAAPVDGNDHTIVRVTCCPHFPDDPFDACLIRCIKQVDAGGGCARCPRKGGAGTRTGIGKHKQATGAGIEVGGSGSRCRVCPGPGDSDVLAADSLDGFAESVPPPVHGVVIGQYADINSGSGQQGGVVGMHAVMDTLFGPGYSRGCGGGFEVDDADIRPSPVKFLQGVPPEPAVSQWTVNGSGMPFGQGHIVAGIFDIWFEKHGDCRPWQALVDAASGHNIAGKEEGQVTLVFHEV